MHLLLLFLVFGQFSLSQNHVYHFVKKEMSWKEAQSYCRKFYTDLASVNDMKDLKDLKAAANGRTDAWIGLHTTDELTDKKWHWSQPTVRYKEGDAKWGSEQPNDENCVEMYSDGLWNDFHCHKTLSCFICYNESSNTTVMIKDADNKRTWLEAQQFCRTHHTDLMSGLDQYKLFQEQNPWPPSYCWFGLFRDTWIWSDGSDSSFRNWNKDQSINLNKNKCAALGAEGRWERHDCEQKKSFICEEGQFSLSQNHVYHFVKKKMSWKEAQSYCKDNHTDLASVNDMKDLKNLKAAANGRTDAWIGLHTTDELTDRKWHWSQPTVRYKEGDAKWASGPPNDENCVNMDSGGRWYDSQCHQTLSRFICYNESSSTTVMINDDTITWLEAQQFCRTHHTDLMSGLDQYKLFQEQKLTPPTFCWIGLFRDTWSWSDGSDSSFRNWNSNTSINPETKKCAALGAEGRWKSHNCGQNKSFICEEDMYVLVKENKTWEEALIHCRHNYRDLAWSIDIQPMKRMVLKRAKMADSEFVWIGLHFACFFEAWVWVDGSYVPETNDNWKEHGGSECGHVAAVERKGGKWFKKNSMDAYNFICMR